MLQSFSVNRFTIFNIEEIITNNSKLADTSSLSSTLVVNITFQKPKWEKQLPKQLSTNALNTCRMSLVLLVEISITNTSKLHSVKAFLDYETTGNFIDHNFVCSKEINTWTISQPIPVFNVDNFPNKVRQILEVVDIVLYYKTHLEQILLAISSLKK